MSTQPAPRPEIKALPTDIGIEQFRGTSVREEKLRIEARWRPWTESPNRIRRLIGRFAVARRLG
jgi:hypothetical protein